MEIKNYKEIFLPKVANKYFINNNGRFLTLNNGIFLSECILKNIQIENGNVSTLVPNIISSEEALRFEDYLIPLKPQTEWIVKNSGYNKILERRKNEYAHYDSYSYLIDQILIFFKENPTGLCVLENYDGEADESLSKESNCTILRHNDEVYYAFENQCTSEQIRQIIISAESLISTIGVLVVPTKDELLYLHTRKELSLEDFQLITKRTKKIFTIAYDGEGFLIWHRCNNSPLIGHSPA